MKKITLIIATMLILPSFAFAASDYMEGTIQGAGYVFNKTVQPISAADPKVVMERDFVLQAENGMVYFLSNVPRDMKVKAVNRTVRVFGDDRGDGTLFVHRIMVKNGNEYITLCNWDKKK